MRTCLITGCNGFIGSYLAESLINRGVAVYGTVHHSHERIDHLGEKISTFECDILDKEKVEGVVRQVKPDFVFHLAAQSRVAPSWQDPEKTLKTNIVGTLYLLEALRRLDTNPVVIVICSAAEYGSCGERDKPLNEHNGFEPSDPYAVSKVAQDLLAHLYWNNYHMRVIRVRPFNITGPRMAGDACSDFARRIVRIEKAQGSTLHVGNLDSVRDITDVRDAIVALWLVAEKGNPGEVYNICSGVGYRIGDLLERMISMSTGEVRILQDYAEMLGSADQVQIGDNNKISELGWNPLIPIEKTLSDMIEFERKRQA